MKEVIYGDPVNVNILLARRDEDFCTKLEIIFFMTLMRRQIMNEKEAESFEKRKKEKKEKRFECILLTYLIFSPLVFIIMIQIT